MKYPIDAFGYLFNARKFDFDTEKTAANFCAFFDNVYCATVPSEDDTREVLANLEKHYVNFHVIDSNIRIEGNPFFDGELKTLAMNQCKNKFRCIVDWDELMVLSNRDKWDNSCRYLLDNEAVDGFMIPSIDLHSSELKIRADVSIGQKFRLHKDTVYARGVPNFAKRSGGLVDTSKSDTTEAITRNGDLCNFRSVLSTLMDLNPIFSAQLSEYPYTLHYGSVSLVRRAKIGREFWKKRWEERSNHEELVATETNQLDKYPLIYHNLPLE